MSLWFIFAPPWNLCHLTVVYIYLLLYWHCSLHLLALPFSHSDYLFHNCYHLLKNLMIYTISCLLTPLVKPSWWDFALFCLLIAACLKHSKHSIIFMECINETYEWMNIMTLFPDFPPWCSKGCFFLQTICHSSYLWMWLSLAHCLYPSYCLISWVYRNDFWLGLHPIWTCQPSLSPQRSPITILQFLQKCPPNFPVRSDYFLRYLPMGKNIIEQNQRSSQ